MSGALTRGVLEMDFAYPIELPFEGRYRGSRSTRNASCSPAR